MLFTAPEESRLSRMCGFGMTSGHCWDGPRSDGPELVLSLARCRAAVPRDKHPHPQRSGSEGADRLSELGGRHDKAQKRGRKKGPFGNVRCRFRLFTAQECRCQAAGGLSIASCLPGASAQLPSCTGQQEHHGGARGRRPHPGSTRSDRPVLALHLSLPGGCRRLAARAAAAATGAFTHLPRHTRG